MPLEPITVLVGPNNSGKSSFMSVGRLVANAALNGGTIAVEQEGDAEYVIHRPATAGNGNVELAWQTDSGSYMVEIGLHKCGIVAQRSEELHTADKKHSWITDSWKGVRPTIRSRGKNEKALARPFFGLNEIVNQGVTESSAVWGIITPLISSRLVKLSPDALRQDSKVVPNPKLTDTGLGMPSVLALWRGADPDKSADLDAFIRQCVPEIKSILVKPAPQDGRQRLWIKQQDGQEFDALHVSDGVLCFIALAMLAIDAKPGSLLFVEEPELSVHPQRIHDLVELLREIVHQRQCQFVLATHSRVLIDQFKDELEAIVRFRRSEHGTVAEQVSAIPKLVEALLRSPPGDLVETGLFSAIDVPTEP